MSTTRALMPIRGYSMSKFLNLFTQEVETVTIPRTEYEELKAKIEYYANRVRQLEHRPFLVERGKTPDGEITWGTPANGMDTLPDA